MTAKTAPEELRQLGQLLGLSQRGRERLVADHVDALPQERLGDREVHVIRRHDRDRLDAVLQPRLSARHLLEIAVGAVLAQAELEPGRLGALGLGRERARDQLVLVVDARCDAMHRADEGALAAADHAEPDPAAETLAASRDAHQIPSACLLALTSVAPPAKSSNACSVTRMM